MESLRGRKLVALAHVTVHAVKEQNLNVSPLWLPHPRHANILGWPEERSVAKQKALELSRGTQVVKPIGIQ